MHFKKRQINFSFIIYKFFGARENEINVKEKKQFFASFKSSYLHNFCVLQNTFLTHPPPTRWHSTSQFIHKKEPRLDMRHGEEEKKIVLLAAR